MSNETLRRRLAAILSADAVGYSRLMADDEVATTRTLRACLERMGTAISRHSGRVVDAVGDNLLAEFASVVDAAACAIEIQRDLAERNKAFPETQRMPFRIGLHLGDVIVEGERIRGDGVNVAARLEGLAPHGGFAISGAAFDLVAGKLGVEFDDLGEMTLKNIPRPMRVYVARLGTEVGGARTEGSEARRIPVAPRPRTRFIGREDARREIGDALKKDRLVTLTGVGGGGKSRLALQVADDVGRDFEAGVRAAELASTSADGQVLAAVATAVGLASGPVSMGLSAEEQLVHSIGDRHMLLVIDNCEHVVEGAAEVADLLLGRCPRLAIMATSREALDIEGERVWQIHPLEVPAPEATFDQGCSTEAMQLFADRAAAARAGFSITPASYSAVRQICERLDGIPLAIELAASRVRHLSPEEIAAHLDDRFRFLTAPSRRSDRRHQTLLATIDWSDGLLTEPQRMLFYRLSVFVGRFAFDAAEAVCGASPLDPVEILGLLGALVDRSLVEVDERHGETRYRLLETIRAYATAQLEAVGERDALRTRHRDWFAQVAERQTRALGVSEFQRPESSAGQYETADVDDVANLRAATKWSLERGDATPSLQLATAIGLVFRGMGQLADAVDFLTRALALDGQAAPEAVLPARLGLAYALIMMGDFAAAFDRFEEVVVGASRQPGFERMVSDARSAQSVAALSSGKGDAEALAQLALESARGCDYEQGEFQAMENLGATRLIAGRFAEAAEILGGLPDRLSRYPRIQRHTTAYHVVAAVLAEDEPGAARAFARLMMLPPSADEPFARSVHAWSVGRARALWCAATGDRGGADQALWEALENQRRAPYPLADADYLVTAGAAAFLAGELERGARLLGAARSAMGRLRSWRGHDAGPIYVTFRRRFEDALGPQPARALFQEGRVVPTEEALGQLRATLARRIAASDLG